VKGFLLDENLPHRLRFKPSLPVQHSTELGPSATDEFIWDYAQKNELVIVTKDADFSERILLAEPPPWVIQLRFGNIRRAEFHTFLEQVWPRLESYLLGHKLINLYRDRIEAVS
jgi:predicted nuclease of predicted toxin-antitoxin system